MTKVIGAVVGAALASGPFAPVGNFFKDGMDQTLVRDRAALATTNVVGDTVSLGFLRSSTLLSPTSKIWNDALGGSVTLAIGDVNYPAGLASAFSVVSAGNGDFWKTFTPAKMGMPLWQALGYAADPGGQIELLATIGGSTVAAAGALAWSLHGHQ